MKKIVLALVIIVSLLFIAGFWFISVHGRGLVIARLEWVTGRKVTLGAVYPKFPAGLVLKDLRIEGLAKIPKAFVTVPYRTLFGGQFEIASLELESPEININLPASVSKGSTAVAAASVQALSPEAAVGRVPAINSVTVRNGTVMVQVPSTGRTWVFEKVQADLSHPAVDGFSVRTDFVAGASLARLNIPFVGHMAKAKGWINWTARDMDASIEVIDADGRVGLSAILLSRANDCDVKGRALLSSSQEAQASGKKPKMIEGAVLDLLGTFQTDIEVDFSFRTPLDRFEVGRVNIAGNMTTGLQTDELSGNIVGSLKAAGASLLEKDKSPMVKPYKL